MAGSVGRVFGVCANEYAPDDGRVVSMDHGCGAHSEVVAAPAALSERSAPVLDEIAFDVVVGEDGDVELVLVDEHAGINRGAVDRGPLDDIVDTVDLDASDLDALDLETDDVDTDELDTDELDTDDLDTDEFDTDEPVALGEDEEPPR
jgi:hypothetical protein